MHLPAQINTKLNWPKLRPRPQSIKPKIDTDKIINQLGCSAVGLLARTALDMDVIGQHHLPPGPKILAANHPTTLDPFLLLTIAPDETNVLVTGGAFTVPLFGRYLRRAGHVPVIRGQGRVAFESAQQRLASGRSIGIFPEGALSPAEGGFHDPRSGAARLALLSGVPVVPIGIAPPHERIMHIPAEIDGEMAMGRFFLSGHYAMTIGEPISFKGDAEDWDTVQATSDRIMGRIAWLSQMSARRRLAKAEPLPTLPSGSQEATGGVTHARV